MDFLGFPSIEGFHNVKRFADAFPDALTGPVAYRGKVKLHGTNAGIRIGSGGVVAAQSRTQIITPQSDNAGFARWVESTRDYWAGLVGDSSDVTFTVFGEWCGQGIMRGTAISNIGKKVFAVFAIVVTIGAETREESALISHPDAISEILGTLPSDVHVLPWYGDEFSVDFRDPTNLAATVATLNKVVADIEPCDPWVKQVFGVEGTAEGVVYYPSAGKAVTVKGFGELAFKAKGEKHKVVATKAAVQVDPEVAANVDAFVAMFVTQGRLEQGLTAVGGSLEMKNIGPFLKWVGTDVQKESVAELEASGLTWDQVQKGVQTAAREWFIAKNKAV